MSKTRAKIDGGFGSIRAFVCECVERGFVGLGRPEFARAPRPWSPSLCSGSPKPLPGVGPSSDFVLVLGLGRPALALVFASDPALRALDLGQLDRLSSSLAALGASDFALVC